MATNGQDSQDESRTVNPELTVEEAEKLESYVRPVLQRDDNDDRVNEVVESALDKIREAREAEK